MRPPTALPPPTGWPADWYPDPYGAPVLRYFDGRRWTYRVVAPRRQAEPHPTLPIVTAFGALGILLASLVASRYLLEYLVRFDWPIVVYVAIAAIVGYGPSVWWCVYATGRWSRGDRIDALGMRLRWSDLGWGPVTWLAALAVEIVVAVLIEVLNIPLTGNTEGIGNFDRDRTYIISLLIVAVVAAPIVEEMVFRGLVLRGFRSRLPAVAAVGLQGFLFGLAHVDPVRGTGNIGLVLVLGAVGATFGGAAYLLRRIGPTIVAHALFNGFVMIIVLTT